MIQGPERFSWVEYRTAWTETGPHPMDLTHTGWTYYDSDTPGDFGRQGNLIEDTPGNGCCTSAVEHQDTATTNMQKAVTTEAAIIDAAFQPHRDVIATWNTYIAGFTELLPPQTPAPPTSVATPNPGAQVPQGDWVTGAEVRYAVAAVNTKGPSPASDWSKTITVHKTAFATITGLGPAPTADTLRIYRQVKPPGKSWGPLRVVANLEPPFPASFDDTDLGGEDW